MNKINIDNFDYSLLSTSTELCEIMKKNGSDKGLGWHNYTIIYEFLFASKRNEYLNIFELGIGTFNTGASLYGWREYFRNSNIYGADINKDILFQTDRISTFYCDQLNENSIKNLWDNPELNEIYFDIIVEDGLHTFDSSYRFLKNSIHKLKKDGIFIIEDLLPVNVNKFRNVFEGNDFQNLKVDLLNIPNKNNNYDNNLLIIRHL